MSQPLHVLLADGFLSTTSLPHTASVVFEGETGSLPLLARYGMLNMLLAWEERRGWGAPRLPPRRGMERP
jgi:hypothetical protein